MENETMQRLGREKMSDKPAQASLKHIFVSILWQILSILQQEITDIEAIFSK